MKLYWCLLFLCIGCSGKTSSSKNPGSNNIEKEPESSDVYEKIDSLLKPPTLALDPRSIDLTQIKNKMSELECEADVGELIESKYIGDEKVDTSQAGHSHRGGVFDIGPRNQATLWKQTYQSFIQSPVCTREANNFLSQGMNQLHGFLHYEAERSFRTAFIKDQNCIDALGYLALMKTIWVSDSNGALQYLNELDNERKQTSQKISGYIYFLRQYYSKKNRENNVHKQCYLLSMQSALVVDEEDLDLYAIFSEQVWEKGQAELFTTSKYDEDSDNYIVDIKKQLDRYLEYVFTKNPLHPSHHYRIHLWDGTPHQFALKSADTVGFSFPQVAHLWHMASHTYTASGDLFDAWWSQEMAARTDHKYMQNTGVLPSHLHNHYHNNEWLTRTMSRLGMETQALSVATNLLQVPQNFMDQDDGENRYDNKYSHISYGSERLSETLIKYGKYQALIDAYDSGLIQCKKLTGLNHLHCLAYTFYAFLELEDENNAKRMLQKISDYNKKNQDDDSIDSYLSIENWMKAIYINDFEVAVENNFLAPLVLERLEKSKKSKLGKKYSSQLTEDIKDYDFITWFAAMKLFISFDELSSAKILHDQIQFRSQNMDLESQKVKEFYKISRKVFKEDLTPVKFQLRATPHERPNLRESGPLLWQPNQAKDIVTNDYLGNSFQLKSYVEKSEKPVLLVLSLTDGCIYCRSQLLEVLKNYEVFSKSFEIVVVSLDSTETIKGLMKQYEGKFGVKNPFVFISDDSENSKIYRDFRSYDDFDQVPMHGTFIIDSSMKILWENISYTAFTKMIELPEEASRLMNPILHSYL